MKVPSSKPKLSRADVEKILNKKHVTLKKYPVILLGIRGYYEDTFGKPGQNDRGFYDDAAFWITKEVFHSFNYNTDPSREREGVGFGGAKGMAVLRCGMWLYQKGPHKGYAAFRQAQAVTVDRDKRGGGSYPDTGWFGINIHRGGDGTTSSLGCQTLPPSQWVDFKTLGYDLMTRKNVETIPYLLIDWSEAQLLVGESQSVINQTPIDSGGQTEEPAEAALNASHVFKLNDRNEGVKTLQKYINEFRTLNVLTPLVEDGDFGPMTESAVKHFQNIMGLVVDGVAGPKTISQLLKLEKALENSETLAAPL